MISSFVIIEEVKQPVNYYVLPSFQKDELYLNLPEIIHEKFANWIEDESEKFLFLEAPAKKFTFTNSKVKWYQPVVNRYGEKSRDLRISFGEMHFGFKRREKC